MASGHLKTPHQQAEHMAAPTSPCDIVQKTLANSEPSTQAVRRSTVCGRLEKPPAESTAATVISAHAAEHLCPTPI